MTIEAAFPLLMILFTPFDAFVGPALYSMSYNIDYATSDIKFSEGRP
jgi:hypothetical protein